MRPKEIIFHASATPPDMHPGWDAVQWVAEIDRWHTARGWSGIGYHWVIARNGTIAKGRPMNKQGAHVKGHNKNTLGVCLIGLGEPLGQFEDHFTAAQMDAIVELVRNLEGEFGRLKLSGHNDYTKLKTCPGFKVGPMEVEFRGIKPVRLFDDLATKSRSGFLSWFGKIILKLGRKN